jgi:hypothetical protein
VPASARRYRISGLVAPGPAGRRRAVAPVVTALAMVAVLALPGAAAGRDRAGASTQVAVRFDAGHPAGRVVPAHFVGLSIEWSLVERYMAPSARPAFVNLLRNLGTGLLRIGGSSQDLMPFDPTAANTNQVITPQDLHYLRATLDAVNRGHPTRPGAAPRWGVVLGTAMAPPSATRPFVSPEHAHRFVTQGVEPAFSGAARRDVAGVELGNEPDLSYGANLERYLADLGTYSAPEVTGPLPIVAPNTSEDILTWDQVDGRTVPTRYFWDWPQILDTAAPQTKARAAAFGAYAADHFYPLARTCTTKPYRCPTTAALLSDQHMDSLDYQVYVHAQEAAKHGLAYRLEETNSAAGRGANGVSNVAASATYALDLMFNTACPQPPNAPGANATCDTGAIGLNFHNAEVNAFFKPEEGNAYYNAIDYDPSAASGAPQAAPLYYAMLLFSRFAQGADGLRPVTMSRSGPDASLMKAWQVGRAGHQRLFLINKSDHSTTASIAVSGRLALVDRMTPYDPAGSGRTLDAPGMRIDGRQVRANGVWPGFHPRAALLRHHHLTITLAAGEAAVVSHG